MTTTDDFHRELLHMRELIEQRLPDVPAEDGTVKRRRVTKDDVLASFLASLNRGGQEHSSVRISRNARGDTQFEVVVRSGDTPEIETAAQAMAEATRLYLVLDEAFTMRREGGGDA